VCIGLEQITVAGLWDRSNGPSVSTEGDLFLDLLKNAKLQMGFCYIGGLEI